MGLQGFERRLERLVEGTFSKAFRSGIEPVEIARRLLREMDAHRTIGVRGVTVVPNHYDVVVASDDAHRFEDIALVLERELATEAREHAREERYRFVGPVAVELIADDDFRQGDLAVEARFEEGPGGRVGALVLGDGRRIELGEAPATIGRLPECEVQVQDSRVSRRHAEVRPDPDGYVLADLDSLNGTRINGTPVKEHVLLDGDEIGVGSSVIRFEAS